MFRGSRGGKIVVLPPARIFLRDEDPAGRGSVERLILTILLFASFFLVRNSIQSLDWDQCRAHRAFVYPLNLHFAIGQELPRRPTYVSRGQKLELFSSLRRRAKGEPDTGAIRPRESDHP